MNKRSVLITGCNGGIGRALCDHFIQQGWEVFGTDIQKLPGLDDQIHFYKFDLSKLSQIRKLEAVFAKNKYRLNCIINNAAFQVCKPFYDMEEHEWDAVFAINLKAPFFLIKQLFPFMDQNDGSVVNVGSVHAIATSDQITAYATSKGALVTMTRALAIELGKYHIRVNAILPGATNTQMLRDGLLRGHVEGTNEEELLASLAEKHVLHRVGSVDEIAKAVYFLADLNQSSFVTGQSIVVDGGATIRLSTE